MVFEQHEFCSYCGTRFETNSWPRPCHNCHNTTFTNPLPVSVAVIPVWDNGKLGTLIQQRNIEPKKGQWALTGGYINRGESWQEGLVREVYEELGLETSVDDFYLLEVISNPEKSTMLVFGECTKYFYLEELKFTPNEEVSAIQVIHEPVALAFPSHTEILKKFF